jgi:hypothetical protein
VTSLLINASLRGDNDPNAGGLYYFLMNGTTIVGGDFIWPGGDPTWQLAALGDFNGDNRPDVVLQNRESGAIVYFLFGGDASLVWEGGDPTWEVVF